MTTKSKSMFKVDRVVLSRKDYDTIASTDLFFLHHLMGTYRRSWSLAGVSFHNLDAKDFVKLYKYCTCQS
jgi:hypothetical protein